MADETAAVRCHAAVAQGAIGSQKAAVALLPALDDPEVRHSAVKALGAIGSAEAVPQLAEA